MKIIAFYTGIYPKGFSPMSYRLHYYMKALQFAGAKVEIVMPAYGELKTNGIFESIPYSFFKTSKPTRFNSIKIEREYVEICSKLVSDCDVLFTTCKGNTLLHKISKIVHQKGKKLAVEINENPYSIFGSRVNIAFFMKLKRNYFLKNTLKKIDGVIVISNALHHLISTHKSNKTELIKVPVLCECTKTINQKNYSGNPYILHAGALSEQKDGIKAMLRAFLIARNKMNNNLKFIFTIKKGLPSLTNWIDNFINKNNLKDCIEFKGLIPSEELEELYNNCSLAIVNKPSNAQNDFNFPTKLTELLTREIPLIVSDTGEMSKYFIDNENAFVVDADNPEQIADKICFILLNPEKTREITKAGRQLAEQDFNYIHYSKPLYQFFESVIAG